MSLYNMLFGANPAGGVLLQILGLSAADIPRIRDVFIDGDNIVIYTRTGGGNREFYDEKNDENPDGPWNSNMVENPHYLRDEDDDFDCTYASFYFKFPDDYAEDLKALAAQRQNHTPSQKWQALFESLGKKN